MGRSIALVVVVLCSLAFALFAQSPSEKQIDTYIRSEMRRRQIPGLALGIFRNGKLEFRRTYGWANLEHRVPVKASTVFQSGSIGKQFTAAGVMLLVEDGKIGLDDPVGRYLTDAPSSWSKITIRRLLNHTAGLGNFGDEVDLTRDYTEAEFWEFIKKSPLKFEPGTDWDYSNIGYVTLGIIIHKVSGEFYGDFLARRIFRPIGMHATRVISEEDIIPDRAAGYHLVDGKIKNQEWVSPSNNTTADGSLYLTLSDLARWDAALNSGLLFKRTSLDAVWSPAKLSDGREWPYGFGWHLGQIGSRRIAYHGGAWQGFKSFIGRVLDDGRTIVLLANSWDTHEFKMAQGVLSLYYPELRHRNRPTVSDTAPADTTKMRRLLMQIVNGTVSADQFSGAGKLQFPDGIRQIRTQLRTLSIPIAVINTSEFIKTDTFGGIRIYRHLLSDVLKSLVLTIGFDPDGKVSVLKLEPA